MTQERIGRVFKHFLLVIAVTIQVSQLGCQFWYHPWYVVEVTAHASEHDQDHSEVSFDRSTKAPQPLKIALLAPDNCENGGTATNTGSARTSRVVLQQSCGSNLGDLEQAIVARGFSVTSWKTIDQAVTSGRAVTAIEAATQQGANLLLQVNSMEALDDQLYPLVASTVRKSNYRGEVGPPVSVEGDRKYVLEQATAPLVKSLSHQTRPGAFLHVTAIVVESGRSAWFYKWNHVQPVKNPDVSISSLFLCNRRILDRCFPRTFKGPSDKSSQSPNQATTVFETSNGQQSENAESKRLLDEVTADMLSELTAWAHP